MTLEPPPRSTTTTRTTPPLQRCRIHSATHFQTRGTRATRLITTRVNSMPFRQRCKSWGAICETRRGRALQVTCIDVKYAFTRVTKRVSMLMRLPYRMYATENCELSTVLYHSMRFIRHPCSHHAAMRQHCRSCTPKLMPEHLCMNYNLQETSVTRQ
ncbi:CYFA0S03e05149g1_1 [Cyberlindnera fabianii]|uniref:CYFA0S03e05149g1_1 n=1 Tax=Cyberlindnera fabianii TaxID=36022 RepID=A0A061AW50_CYBFA|nr:CYFA0S03e05149g1_1 [Cyberlindnera fabianii]